LNRPGAGLLGVVAALEAEARTLGVAVRRHDGLASLGGGALLAVSGMGATKAAPAARRLVDAGASALMSFGLAGGLDPKLDPGAVVLPGEVISRNGARFPTSAQWCRQLTLAVAEMTPVASGTLLTSAQPIDTPELKAAAFRETGAAAVDMESLSVAEVAAAHDLPFMAVRVIVDGAADVLPQAVLAASRGGHLSVLRLVLGLAVAPRDIVAVIRLARRYRAATRSLSAVVRDGLIA
jgi:adenosylhomocysteine nucleosidase